jgi:hypothetical protein
MLVVSRFRQMAPITGEGAKSGVDRKLLESVSVDCDVSCGLIWWIKYMRQERRVDVLTGCRRAA